MPSCIASYVVNVEKKMGRARVSHTQFGASPSKENKRCTSQHMHITIVELVHRLHGKTRIFLFFVRNRGWLKHIHSLYLVGQRTGPGNGLNKAQCLPISCDFTSLPFYQQDPDVR